MDNIEVLNRIKKIRDEANAAADDHASLAMAISSLDTLVDDIEDKLVKAQTYRPFGSQKK